MHELSPILRIDTNAIKSNWLALNQKSGGKASAVVKANAYGLGLKNVLPTLVKSGVTEFFVATYLEALDLKKLVPDSIIYELSGQSIYQPAIDKIYPVINSPTQARHLDGRKFALQIDTGMTRLGINFNDLCHLATSLPELVLSHLACSDDAHHHFNNVQLKNFIDYSAAFPLSRKSLAATGGVLLGDNFRFDLTRPGIGIYGGTPFTDASPVVQLSLPVLQTYEIQTGTQIGYSSTYTAKGPMRVATVLGGYADGIPRQLSNQGNLFHEGHACPILGRISMDSLTVDISHFDRIPDQLELTDPTQTIDDIATKSNTIAYEILTGLGKRFETKLV